MSDRPRKNLGTSVRLLAALALTSCGASLTAASPTPSDVEFFEKQVRPLLAAQCHACHSSKGKMHFAGLTLDTRAGLQKGSDSGPVIVAGKPNESKLIQMIRGELPLRMPPTGKLKDDQIATLVRWVEMGAPWPAEASEAAFAGFSVQKRAAEHWAWQPVKVVNPPGVHDQHWPRQDVDRFILANLEKLGLKPAAAADRRTLLRRVTFDLTGLPPSPEDLAEFELDSSAGAYEKQVDRLLSSPHFAEHWARHWMDLVRYSESHGSEDDPDTPGAWRYRDYLIRAFHNDVPYDQMIREHLSGDLMPEPRLNEAEGINESLIAPAHFRMIEHGYQPVDPWEDRVRWTDNQIDVFSKAFQGLTVSCARCHDHKFDAISQKDYYALFGVFSGARPTQRTIDLPDRLNGNRDQLVKAKREIRGALAGAWQLAAASLPDRLRSDRGSTNSHLVGLGALVLIYFSFLSVALLTGAKQLAQKWKPAALPVIVISAALMLTLTASPPSPDAGPMLAWEELRNKSGDAFRAGWRALAARSRKEAESSRAFNSANFHLAWDLRRGYGDWLRQGAGMTGQPSQPGEFWISPAGDSILTGIYPGGVYTNLLSAKHNGVVSSPRFRVDSDSITLRMLGGKYSFAVLIVENYAVPRALGIYKQRVNPTRDRMGWVRWDTSFWKGFTAYIEFATMDDVTHIHAPDAEKDPLPKDGRSWFGAQTIYFHNNALTPRSEPAALLHVLEGAEPDSPEALARRYSDLLLAAIDAWTKNTLTEAQAEFLDFFVQHGMLPTTLNELAPVRPLVASYRQLEEEVPLPRRAPGIVEEGGADQALLIRGNPKNPGPVVPKRYLEAFGGEAYSDARTARLRLAAAVASPSNSLTGRVMVNRIWQHMFGAGIVRTVDNFGKLGESPSHPELLDWLAGRFVGNGWSIKKTVRLLATSRAYQMRSTASEQATLNDPGNRWLQHMPVRRLEAESIRDAILWVSGQLDGKMYGPSVPTFYTHETGRTKGDRPKGPLDGARRRSVYLEVRRNVMNPFLEAFDVPKPASTRGERDMTNVPAQSLTLLNNPFVIDQAARWMGPESARRIDSIFLRALGRAPSPLERDRAETLLAELRREHKGNTADAWRDLAHTIFNLKEFLYVQ